MLLRYTLMVYRIAASALSRKNGRFGAAGDQCGADDASGMSLKGMLSTGYSAHPP
jgi:hypothetical protein